MIQRNPLATGALLLLATACGAGANLGGLTGADKNDDTNGGPDDGLAEAGRNSLGIGSYDMRIIVPRALSLTGDGGVKNQKVDQSDAQQDGDGRGYKGDDAQAGDAPDSQDGDSKDVIDPGEDDDEDRKHEKGHGGMHEARDHELKACSKAFGKPVSGIKLAGNGNTLDLTRADGLIAIKLAGNHAAVSLLVTAAPAAAGAGLTDEQQLPPEVESGDAPDQGDADTDASQEDDGDDDGAKDDDDSTGGDVPTTQTEDATPDPSQSADAPAMEGICIIARGNEPTTNVVLNDLTVGKIVYLGAGNQATANFEIKAGAAADALKIEQKGNAGKVRVTGDGKYDCNDITIKGNAAEVQCGP